MESLDQFLSLWLAERADAIKDRKRMRRRTHTPAGKSRLASLVIRLIGGEWPC